MNDNLVKDINMQAKTTVIKKDDIVVVDNTSELEFNRGPLMFELNPFNIDNIEIKEIEVNKHE